jgi:hypothetical protein
MEDLEVSLPFLAAQAALLRCRCLCLLHFSYSYPPSYRYLFSTDLQSAASLTISSLLSPTAAAVDLLPPESPLL